MRPTLASVVLVADLTGTLVFAAEGAMVASARHLDLFGIMVLACVVALGGGHIRARGLGAPPPPPQPARGETARAGRTPWFVVLNP
ncbi:MAG: TRIC cation channel family protein, partial [Gluconacetobacter sp.]